MTRSRSWPRSTSFFPRLRERAQQTENLRRLPDANIAELDEAGFFKMVQPEQWGGLQCDPTLFSRRCAALPAPADQPDGPAAFSVFWWHLAQFDQRAQEEVWGSDPTVRISRRTPLWGAGVVVDGGYLVNGTWLWSSGCDHASWTFVGGPVIKDGRPVDFGSFLMPLGDYQIRDDWHVVGLKGTGSNTLIVKDVFVPRHRFPSYRP